MTYTRATTTLTEELQRYDEEAILADLMSDQVGETIGALLLPAFDAETLLRYQPATSTLQMSSYASSLWYFLSELKERETEVSSLNLKQRLLAKHRGVKPPVPTPWKWTETQSVSPGHVAEASLLASAFDDARAEVGHKIGLDGMSILAFKWSGTSILRFRVWSPRPSSKAHRFVLLLYRLAERNLKSDDAERRLESIHSYLDLGLPWKVFSESPLVVRLFGSLSSTHVPALRQKLHALPHHERVVMDVTRLSGMGAQLHQVWRSWLDERTNIFWAEGKHISDHLDAIGVPRERRFPDLATASVALGSRSPPP